MCNGKAERSAPQVRILEPSCRATEVVFDKVSGSVILVKPASNLYCFFRCRGVQYWENSIYNWHFSRLSEKIRDISGEIKGFC
jgi:hypothetical protein